MEVVGTYSSTLQTENTYWETIKFEVADGAFVVSAFRITRMCSSKAQCDLSARLNDSYRCDSTVGASHCGRISCFTTVST